MGCCCSQPSQEGEEQSLLSNEGREDLEASSEDWRAERERSIQQRSEQFHRRHEAAVAARTQEVDPQASEEEGTEVLVEGGGQGGGRNEGGEVHPSILLQSQMPEEEMDEEERERAREEARRVRERKIIERENASLVDLETEILKSGGKTKLEGTGTHDFIVTTFKKPTYCRYCCGFIFGVYHQGYRCFDCGFPAHDMCRRLIQPETQLGVCYKVMKPESNWQQEIEQIKKKGKKKRGEEEEGEEEDHRFQPFNFLRPTYCRHCCKFIVGALQGAICSDCGFPAHMHCSKLTQLPCANEIKKDEDWYAEVKQIKKGEGGDDDDDEEGEGENTRGNEEEPKEKEKDESEDENDDETDENEEEQEHEDEMEGEEKKEAFSTPAPEVAHLFESKTFHRPTYCAHCLGFIYGVVNQGVICQICNFPAHHDCQSVAAHNCSVPKPPKEWLRLIKQQKKDEGKGVRAQLLKFGKSNI